MGVVVVVNGFSRAAAGFESQAVKTVWTEFLYKKSFMLDGLENQAGKSIIEAGQFVQCPALDETPSQMSCFSFSINYFPFDLVG